MSYLPSYNFATLVRRGNIPGWDRVLVFGHSDSINTNKRTLHHEMNTADLDTIALYDTPATIKVASTSANDTNSAGTGARTVRVYGVNSSGALVSEDFTLNGTTETAASSTTFKAVHYTKVLTAGTSQWNEGIIWVGSGTFTSGVPATKYDSVEANTSQSATAHYLVPTGKSLYPEELTINLGDTTKTISVTFSTYDGAVIQEEYDFHSQAANIAFPTEQFGTVPADTLIFVEALVNTGTAKGTVGLECYLVDD